MQGMLTVLQYEEASSHGILIFVISIFGCPPALDARVFRPVYPPSARLMLVSHHILVQ